MTVSFLESYCTVICFDVAAHQTLRSPMGVSLQVRVSSCVTLFHSLHCAKTASRKVFQTWRARATAVSLLSLSSCFWPSSASFAARNSCAACFVLSSLIRASPGGAASEESFYTRSNSKHGVILSAGCKMERRGFLWPYEELADECSLQRRGPRRHPRRRSNDGHRGPTSHSHYRGGTYISDSDAVCAKWNNGRIDLGVGANGRVRRWVGR